MKKNLIILSGGQDSITCLLMAIKKYKPENVFAISFIYNKKYRRDIECAKRVCKDFNIKHEIFDIGVIHDISGTNNFEGRNLLLISLAAIYAKRYGIYNVICGLSANSSHSDCSLDFFKVLSKNLKIAIGKDINLEAPLINLEKTEIWEIADKLGYLEYIQKNSFSCWNSQKDHCMKCLSCKARFDGLEKYYNLRKKR